MATRVLLHILDATKIVSMRSIDVVERTKRSHVERGEAMAHIRILIGRLLYRFRGSEFGHSARARAWT
jgi:hypothetical protein